MRIVNKQEFLKLPKNTVFSKYKPCVFDHFKIKDSSCKNSNKEYIDYFYTSIHDAVDIDSTEDFIKKLDEAQKNSNFEIDMNFDVLDRDGRFDKDQLFAVWSKEDISKLIERLKECL